jgi:hypothetical protein
MSYASPKHLEDLGFIWTSCRRKSCLIQFETALFVMD